MSRAYLERVDRLRSTAVAPYISYEECYLHFFARYEKNEERGSRWERYADAFEYAFAHVTPFIGEEELIVGRGAYCMTEAEKAEWGRLREQVALQMIRPVGQDSHMAIDYESVLREGTEGVIARIEREAARTDDCEKLAFYETCKACLRAVTVLAGRYADEAQNQAEACTDESRRKELLNIAAICRRVPAKPAKTFHEAVQATHFISYCLSMDPFRFFSMLQFQLGRIDRYLYPYYQADKAAGRLTDDEAQLLIDCLAIQINNRVPRGLSSGYMLGGRDREGNIVANELTLMGMQAIDDIRLVYPSVGLCMTRETPEEYLKKACEVLSHGRSHPAIFNDDIITEGLMGYGVTADQAHDYIHSTCVEITPAAASNVWVASPYTNMVQLLLDLMDREYNDFDELLSALFAHLDQSIERNWQDQNNRRRIRREHSINPLLSCFVQDCIARGTDIEQGGAKYNWIMPSFVGMANLVDSLYVIKKMIFEKKELTFAQLRDALNGNFEGCEPLRLKILNGVEKYGNDSDDVDRYFSLIVGHIVEECRKYECMFSEGRLIPSVFCWVMHERFGRETGASPDGRKAGFPLGDGSGPCQGRERSGPTASVLSSTKWSHKELIGGVAVNMKFTKKTFTESSAEKVRSLIHVYLDRGGFEMQINVVDYDTLIEAQKYPEEYADLVVRIGGYSDYFVKLSPEMQAEVLLRTSHEV